MGLGRSPRVSLRLYKIWDASQTNGEGLQAVAYMNLKFRDGARAGHPHLDIIRQ